MLVSFPQERGASEQAPSWAFAVTQFGITSPGRGPGRSEVWSPVAIISIRGWQELCLSDPPSRHPNTWPALWAHGGVQGLTAGRASGCHLQNGLSQAHKSSSNCCSLGEARGRGSPEASCGRLSPGLGHPPAPEAAHSHRSTGFLQPGAQQLLRASLGLICAEALLPHSSLCVHDVPIQFQAQL